MTLSDGQIYSLYKLATELNSNTQTVKRNLYFLEQLGLVEVNKISKAKSASNKTSYRITITELGNHALQHVPND